MTADPPSTAVSNIDEHARPALHRGKLDVWRIIASTTVNFCLKHAYEIQEPVYVALAMALVKPSLLYYKGMGREDLITKERYGSGKRIFIVCEGDNVVPEEIQKWIICNYEPNEVKLNEEAGHMTMHTKPQQLSQM